MPVITQQAAKVAISLSVVFFLISLVFVILYSLEHDKKQQQHKNVPADPADPSTGGGGHTKPTGPFIEFLQNNTRKYGDVVVPMSFYVERGYFDKILAYGKANFQKYDSKDRYDKAIAMNNQKNGFSTYDAAVWCITMWRFVTEDTEYWREKVGLFLTYLGSGRDYLPLITPREQPDGSNPFTYNGTSATSFNIDYDKNTTKEIGYHFRNLPASGFKVGAPPWVCSVGNGDYDGQREEENVKIKTSVYPGCVFDKEEEGYTETDQLYMTWSDWRPVTGENMWCLNAACHALYDDKKDPMYSDEILRLAKRLYHTCAALEIKSIGAPYYSPQKQLPKERGLGWDMYAYSVENMASTISALVNFSDVTKTTDNNLSEGARNYAGRIGNCILNHIKKNHVYGKTQVSGYTVLQGGTFADLSDPTVRSNTRTLSKQYATDCTTWSICVMGDKIDTYYGHGTCFELFQNVKKYNGYTEGGVCMGLGYTFNNTAKVHSSEWSAGGWFAAKLMLLRLYANDKVKAASLKLDLLNFRRKLEEQNRDDMEIKGTALNYCNKRNYEIPFGWIGQENAATCSTGWYVWLIEGKNPFRLDMELDFCDFKLNV